MAYLSYQCVSGWAHMPMEYPLRRTELPIVLQLCTHSRYWRTSCCPPHALRAASSRRARVVKALFDGLRRGRPFRLSSSSSDSSPGRSSSSRKLSSTDNTVAGFTSRATTCRHRTPLSALPGAVDDQDAGLVRNMGRGPENLRCWRSRAADAQDQNTRL
jgi:hypothetical protein